VHEKGLQLYFANHTSWSGKAASYAFEREEHIHMGVEHHLMGEKCKQARGDRNRQGYTVSAKQAFATGRSE
jgi:hypothetical protein